MQVEQAVFTSARTRQARGYHLVARSPGIDEDLAQTLTAWGPSHASLVGSELDFSSLNFFPAGNGWLALTRTVFGGPEYSDRGGLQVVTLILALRREQLAGYGFDPVALGRTALTMGQLRLFPLTTQRLPTIDLPDESIIGRCSTGAGAGVDPEMLSQTRQILANGQRVALIGMDAPLELLDCLMHETPPEQRPDVSFTTGLKPSMHRAFRLHFFPATDDALQDQLASQGITCVHAAVPAGRS